MSTNIGAEDSTARKRWKKLAPGVAGSVVVGTALVWALTTDFNQIWSEPRGAAATISQSLPKWEYHKVKAGVLTTIPVAGVAYCFDDQGKYQVVERDARTSKARIEVSGPDGEIAVIKGARHLIVQAAPGCAKFF